MGYLVRRTRRAVWVGDGRDRESAVWEFARSDDDVDGLSVFEVETDEQRALVAAAIACERQNTGRVDLLEVSREEAEGFGPVRLTPNEGTTPVPEANALHCSLDWDALTLRRFAEHLFDAGRVPREYATTDVRAAVRSLNVATVIGEEAQAFVRAEKTKGALVRKA